MPDGVPGGFVAGTGDGDGEFGAVGVGAEEGDADGLVDGRGVAVGEGEARARTSKA